MEKKKVSIFDKYSFYLWAIVILLITTITLVPFIPGILMTVFGISVYYTPALIISPVLMGIIYAVMVSYETPNMSPKKKKVFKIVKIADIALFYAISIAIIVTAAINGNINF